MAQGPYPVCIHLLHGRALVWWSASSGMVMVHMSEALASALFPDAEAA